MTPEQITALRQAYELLTDYLLENTKEVFEEIPEIDQARSILQEVLGE